MTLMGSSTSSCGAGGPENDNLLNRLHITLYPTGQLSIKQRGEN